MTRQHTSSTSGRAPGLLLLSTIAAVALLLSGCGDGEEVDARALFAANCAVCHGPAGEGGAGAPPLSDPAYLPDQLSDAEMTASIRNGVQDVAEDYGAMPGFSRFDEEQLAALVELVRELQGS